MRLWKPGREGEASDAMARVPWGEWDLSLRTAGPERAVLQWLEALPDHTSWEHVDQVFQGLTNLRPNPSGGAFAHPKHQGPASVPVVCQPHPYPWLSAIRQDAIDLGRGKRMLVRGRRLDKKHQIKVPESLAELTQC